jgi:hypothetical protein
MSLDVPHVGRQTVEFWTPSGHSGVDFSQARPPGGNVGQAHRSKSLIATSGSLGAPLAYTQHAGLNLLKSIDGESKRER